MSIQRLLSILVVVGITVGLTAGFSQTLLDTPAKKDSTPQPSSDQDHRLQAAATSALGAREGAILVLDPQTGRVRAVVNSVVAFQSSFPPGSTIKPFTTLSAMRSGVIEPGTRLRCRGKYKKEDVVDACVHPRNLAAFSPSEALAYSCNYYFATVGERLKEEDFAQLLTDFGFGQSTGIGGEAESRGEVARGRWRSESAVGEGPFLQVTPIQMGMAYVALLNGGRLLKPNYTGGSTLRANLQISDEERAILLEGMRGAVKFGTAEQANLDSLPVPIAGKTGTATQLGGFRSQGWFVGFAFSPDAPPEPANVQLTVVVYLKHAHGAEAAEVARPIFEEFAGKSTSNRAAYYFPERAWASLNRKWVGAVTRGESPRRHL